VTRPVNYLLAAVVALALLWAALSFMGRREEGQGQAQETQSAIHTGEAQAHVQAAQSIPDHAPALAQAKADSARAWAEVRRLRELVAAQKPGVPDQGVSGEPAGQPPVDHRDELLAADAVLIEAQAGQIAVLGLALQDEQHRSAELKAAYEAERKATAAQAAATKAWKDAVTTSRWRGRIEGFAAGAALGYVGGRR
jgi:hypothetical protein